MIMIIIYYISLNTKIVNINDDNNYILNILTRDLTHWVVQSVSVMINSLERVMLVKLTEKLVESWKASYKLRGET